MLTGDKLETAQNIGFSTRLLEPFMDKIQCSATDNVEDKFNQK